MILDGKKLSKQGFEQLKKEVSDFKDKYGCKPFLAVVLVGEDPASLIYVNKKVKACKELGMDSVIKTLPKEASLDELNDLLETLKNSKEVQAILVQLPLPSHLKWEQVASKIDPLKDADALSLKALSDLVMNQAQIYPCTPFGIIELLKHYKFELKGKNCVVLGRSLIVGKPLSYMLTNEGATVTLCHSQSLDIDTYLKQADFIFVAVGKKEFLKDKEVSKKAVIVDVGIHRTDQGKIVGDVCFDQYKDKVKAITPVPGGVGPMTIYSLMKNTLKLAQIQMELKK